MINMWHLLLTCSGGPEASLRHCAPAPSVDALPSSYKRATIRHDIRQKALFNILNHIATARHSRDLHLHSAGVGLVYNLRYPWLDNRAPYLNTTSSTLSKYEYIISTSTSKCERHDYVRLTRSTSESCRLAAAPPWSVREVRTRIFTPPYFSRPRL